MTAPWHILTPELPPGCGGVGDYVAQLAEGLSRAGQDRVTVWTPPADRPWDAPRGVEVVSLPDRFGRASMGALAVRLNADGAGARLLVQYVPNVFGRRRVNLPFCFWLRRQQQSGRDVRVMFHEPFLYFDWRPDHVAIALAQRAMAAVLLRAATQIYLSTTTWRRSLRPYGPATTCAIELPIPSAIPHVEAAGEVRTVRAAIGSSGPVLGHFGSYGTHVAPLLRRTILSVLTEVPSASVLCTGAGSDAFAAAVVRSAPRLASRVQGRGRASARDVSVHLQACDLLVQPYPDGVTTRRTSAMAGLANRVAVLTTDGPLTEAVWRQSGAVALAPASDPREYHRAACQLLADAPARAALARRGQALYDERFDLRHTIATLVGPGGAHA